MKIVGMNYHHSRKLQYKPIFISPLVFFSAVFFHSMLCLDYKFYGTNKIYFKVYESPEKAVEIFKHTLDLNPKRSPVSTGYEPVYDDLNILDLKITHDGWFKDTTVSVRIQFTEVSSQSDLNQLVLKADLGAIRDEYQREFKYVLDDFSTMLYDTAK